MIKPIATSPAPPPIAVLKSIVIDKDRQSPAYVQLTHALRNLIRERLNDGQMFWPELTIVENVGLARGTVRRALAELTLQGSLRRTQVGSFVVKDPGAIPSLTSVGVFVEQYDSDFLTALLQEIATQSGKRGLHFRIYHTQPRDSLAQVLTHVRGGPDDEGLILLEDARGNAVLFEAFHDRGYHTVMLGVTNPEGASVETDSSAAIQIGLHHLFGLGHKRITLLVNEPAEEPSVGEKMTIFENIMATHPGAAGNIVVCGTRHQESSFEAAYANMTLVMARNPTAIFAVSDPGAWAALKWLAEQRIAVPSQVSVVGFEDVRPSRYTQPAVTTVAHPIPAIVSTALDRLSDRQSIQTRLLPRLVVRDSTGPPPDHM